MRYYRSDGTFRENTLDTQFGWFLRDIGVDEGDPDYQRRNRRIKEDSRRRLFMSAKPNSSNVEGSSRAPQNDLEESVDVPDACVKSKQNIIVIEPNIVEETATDSTCHPEILEGLTKDPRANFLHQVNSIAIPSKEKLLSLISPVNAESKALVSVISSSKYDRLNDRKTTEYVLSSVVNFRATKSKHLLNEMSPFKCPDHVNFLLNDAEVDLDRQLASEIRTYHDTKEDNMLSLMMELINSDMDSNLEDATDTNSFTCDVPGGGEGTSDLGTSVHSSMVSNYASKNCFLDIPNKSDILNSLGLSSDLEQSIESFAQDKLEMVQQLKDVKSSFEENDRKIDNLLSAAAGLQNDLRATNFLDNLIYLLNGDLKKVKNARFPFNIFHSSSSCDEMNLIL